MKIYTRTGDQGETALFGGSRVSKDHTRIDAYGTVDELNAQLGLVRVGLDDEATRDLDELLDRVQHQLFDLGAELATPSPEEKGTARLGAEQISALERAIDEHDAQLSPLTQFILPGGSRSAAELHLARCICRRAERRVVALGHHEAVRDTPVRYLNRLSDLLFVLARTVNQRAGVGDVGWSKDR